ncbi:hypothetical protein PIB30_019560 [Stylosanthes scabra]|uniref:Uncharacterized protein n=1 Tax=Stylosanthes scabra TaxID=79078 RepID=A0ABU6X9Q7_9FABA|nr:hypothetical protein [Stylosanthes scabra]
MPERCLNEVSGEMIRLWGGCVVVEASFLGIKVLKTGSLIESLKLPIRGFIGSIGLTRGSTQSIGQRQTLKWSSDPRRISLRPIGGAMSLPVNSLAAPAKLPERKLPPTLWYRRRNDTILLL